MSWRQVHLARAVYAIRGNVDGVLECFKSKCRIVVLPLAVETCQMTGLHFSVSQNNQNMTVLGQDLQVC